MTDKPPTRPPPNEPLVGGCHLCGGTLRAETGDANRTGIRRCNECGVYDGTFYRPPGPGYRDRRLPGGGVGPENYASLRTGEETVINGRIGAI